MTRHPCTPVDVLERTAATRADVGDTSDSIAAPDGTGRFVCHEPAVGRADEVPLVFLGRITIATGTQGPEEVDAMEEESFRYSDIGTRALSPER